MVWRMVLMLETIFSKLPQQCDLVYFSAWTLNVGSGSFWGHKVEQLTGLIWHDYISPRAFSGCHVWSSRNAGDQEVNRPQICITVLQSLLAILLFNRLPWSGHLAAPWFLFNPTIPHLYRFHMLPCIRHALIHQACLWDTKQKEHGWNMLVTLAAPCWLCWQRYKRLLSLAACSKLELTITAVTLGWKNDDPPLLQDQGFPADWPTVPPNNPWSKRPSSWSRCQPPKWPCKKSNSSSKQTGECLRIIQIDMDNSVSNSNSPSSGTMK